MYKALVVGCGSIGQLYVELLKRFGTVDVFDINCDLSDDVASRHGVSSLVNLEDVQNGRYSHIVIATPPSTHLNIANKFLDMDVRILVEKPITLSSRKWFDFYNETETALAEVFVTSNMRFHPGVKHVKNALDDFKHDFIHADLWFFHNFQVMRPHILKIDELALNQVGGLLFDCIHEFDLAVWLFDAQEVEYARVANKQEDGLIRYMFVEVLLAGRGGGAISIKLDYLSNLKRRGVSVTGRDWSSEWNGVGKSPEMARLSNSCKGVDQQPKASVYCAEVDRIQGYSEMVAEFVGSSQPSERLQRLSESLKPIQLIEAAHGKLS